MSDPKAKYRSQKPLMEYIGVANGPTSIVPLVFARMKTSDELEECDASPEFVKNVGTIELRIQRISKVVQEDSSSGNSIPLASKVVHESTKKGLMSHAIDFGAAEETEEHSYCTPEYLDPFDTPFAIFKFFYRSRGSFDLSYRHISADFVHQIFSSCNPSSHLARLSPMSPVRYGTRRSAKSSSSIRTMR